MRLSAIETDPGYLPSGDYRRANAKIYLDGVEQANVVTADEDEGLVVAPLLDDHGHIIADQSGNYRMDERRGSVRIDVPTGMSAISAIAKEARSTVAWKADHHINAGRVDNHYSHRDCMDRLDAVLNRTRQALEATP